MTNLDTASAVAQEMMESKIIEYEDMIIVASKISDLVDAFAVDNKKISEKSGKCALFLFQYIYINVSDFQSL